MMNTDMKHRPFKRLYVRAVVSMTLCLIAWNDAMATGVINQRPNRLFRQLVVQGERPEIVSCLLGALEFVKKNPQFSEIIIPSNVSETAIMQETINNDRLMRKTTFNTLAKVRPKNVLSMNAWDSVSIQCEQTDESHPLVNISLKP